MMEIIQWRKVITEPELADHQLNVVNQPNGFLKLRLVVRKLNTQYLPLTVDGSQGEFLTYWSNQRYQWDELVRTDEGSYCFAIRVIALRDFYLVWIVRHTDGVANDEFSQFVGTKEEVIAFFS